MILKRKTTRRIFSGLCLMFLIGTILFALSSDAEKAGKFEQEQSKRAEGLRFRRLSLQDENGRIDPDGLRNARRHIEEMKKVQPARRLKQRDHIAEAGVLPDSWESLGPGNIGGRVRSISINPTNTLDILIGSVSGGIWRTFNGGDSWFPVHDFMANLAVSTLARKPTDASVIYAGTGEGFGNIDAIQGAGIFRSLDGGILWFQLASTNNPNFNFVNRIAISPNGAIILAATNTGVWRSEDAGASWSQRTVNNNTNSSPDIDFHPTDNQYAIVGELGFARYSQSSGLTWTAATFNPPIGRFDNAANDGRVELAFAPSDPTIVFASVNNNSGNVYRSDDGGQTYNSIHTGLNYMSNQGWYNNALWVNPRDPNMIIVGGVDLLLSVNATTNFVSFSQIGNCTGGNSHVDHHVIVAQPDFDNVFIRTIYGGNDGGVFRADSGNLCGTGGWTERNNQLGITQFYSAAGNPTSGRIIGGTQDNTTLRYTGLTEFWTPMTDGGDGGQVASDQTNPNYFYGEFQNLGVVRSDNGGNTSTQITSGLGDFTGISCTNCRTNFIAPIALDPNEPTRLLAGGWSLWRTNDARGAAQWTEIKTQTGVPIPPTGPNPRPISAIRVSPGNSDFIVVGHNNGDVFLTFNGTNTTPIPNWSRIDIDSNTMANLLPDRFVTRLVVDTSRSPNWIYATFGGFNADNVYVSRNFGASWTDITGAGATGLPNVPVRSLVIHPHNPDLLYVGTEVGIFTSNDAGATWDLPNGGPANVSVDELFWMGGDLIAATHGRGMYRASGGYYVDCNYNGVQFGTFTQPYKTVNAAINAIPANRHTPIWLKPCNYVEQVNTVNNPNKRFEIRALGDATVTSP